MKNIVWAVCLALGLTVPTWAWAEEETDSSSWCTVYIECYRMGSGVWSNGAGIEVWQDTVLRGVARQTHEGQRDTVGIAVNPVMPVSFHWRTDSIANLYAPTNNMLCRFSILNPYYEIVLDYGRGFLVDDTAFFLMERPCFGCWAPENVAIDSLEATRAVAVWQGPAAATQWHYMLTADGTEESRSGTGMSNRVPLEGLTPGMGYTFTVYAVCSGDVSDSVSIQFTTPYRHVDELPYITGFEVDEDCGWSYANGTNQWVIGAATAQAGSRSLYISANWGLSNGYDDQPCVSWAWRDIDLPYGGQYELEFDWKALGERLSMAYDYMRVFLAPDSAELVANTFPERQQWPTYANDSYFNNYTPTGWMAFPTAVLQGQAYWQHFQERVNLDSAQTGRWRLCFVWVNDNSTSRAAGQRGDPAAAIDNLTFRHICAIPPTGLTLDSVDINNNAYLHWTGSMEVDDYAVFLNDSMLYYTSDTHCVVGGLRAGTRYRVSVAAVCEGNEFSERDSLEIITPCQVPLTVPYAEDFEYEVEGNDACPCWEKVGWIRGQQEDGNRYLAFSQYHSAVVLPAFDTAVSALEVMFRARPLHGATDVIVGVAREDAGDSLVVDTLQVVGIEDDDQWRDYTVPLRGYAGTGTRVYIGSSQWVMIDDMVIDRGTSCNRPSGLSVDSYDSISATLMWSSQDSGLNYIVRWADNSGADSGSVVVGDTSATITGLSSSTLYTVKVQAVCPNGDALRPIWCRFSTDCGPAALPLFEDFSVPGSLPQCWHSYPLDASTAVPAVQHGAGGEGELYFQVGGTVVLPEVDLQLAAVQLEFDYGARLLVVAPIQVGVMEDSLFVPIDTITSTGHQRVFFTAYTGTSRRIALCILADFPWTTVDNLKVDYLSSCLPVRNLVFLDADEESLTIDWTDIAENPEGYEISVSNGPDTLFFHETLHPCTLGGLEGGTPYTLRVRTLCQDDTAVWSSPLVASTLCPVVNLALGDIVADSFEDSVLCWREIGADGVVPANTRVHHAHHSGTYALNLPSRNRYLFSPRVESTDSVLLTLYHNAYFRNPQVNLHIGYATELSPDAIHWVDTLDETHLANTWLPYGRVFPSEANYIVFHKSTDFSVLIDDVFIGLDDGLHSYCPPAEITSVEVDDERVTVHWSAVADAYYYNSTFYGWNDSETGFGTTDTQTVVYGFDRYGDTLVFGVRSVCPLGVFSEWTLVSIEMVDPACQLPNDFTLTETSATQTLFEWDTSEGPELCEALLFRGNTVQRVAASTSPMVVPDLTPNTAYRLVARALCGEHHPGAWPADTIDFTTTACLPVGGLTASRNANGSVLLDWVPAPNGIGQWMVYFRRTDLPSAPYTQVQTAVRPFSLSGLEVGVEWELRVASYCTSEDLSDMSAPLIFSDSTESVDPVAAPLEGLVLRPNPATDLVYVDIEGADEPVDLHLLDLAGRVVASVRQAAPGQPVRLNVGGLPAGTYFVRAVGSQQVGIGKLVVK